MMDVQLASLFASGAFIIIGLFAAIFIDNLIKKKRLLVLLSLRKGLTYS